jgi:hypothetical protein
MAVALPVVNLPSVAAPLAVSPAPAVPAPEHGGATFGDFLDMINPLQHIPIVSTIYRAITGEHIKTFPKIAGDMLYGGVTGFLGSLADTIFEKVTGKSVGDTVLAFAEDLFSSSHDAPATAVASAAVPPAGIAVHAPTPLFAADTVTPVSVTPAALDTIAVPGQEALLLALTRNGTDPAIAQRAADAYRRSIDVADKAAAAAARH